MSPMGNGYPGQQGSPPRAGQLNQINTATSGGNVYSAQGGNQYINVRTSPSKRGLRTDTKVLLVTLLVDVVLFLYGMLAYTGKNTSGDNWRAGVSLVMFLMTIGMISRWIRRRA